MTDRLRITTGELADAHRVVTEALQDGVRTVDLTIQQLDVIRRVLAWHLQPHVPECECGHLQGRHQLTNLGVVTHCADCGCQRFKLKGGQ